MSVALIDYQRGNLRSVGKALEKVGVEVRLVAAPEDLEGATAVVLPGVGAFGDAALQLQSTGLWDPLQNWIREGRPFLGICLGYQLLFEGSEESPEVRGLGVLRGFVRRFARDSPLKVPQMGWNTLELTPHAVWEGLEPNPYVYFVHSFYPAPMDTEYVTAWCNYGVRFAAAYAYENLVATQFHPEKSQATGLGILANWAATLPR